MSTKDKIRGLFSGMAARLWLIMMSLVLFTIFLMWTVQIFVMERNYINMAIASTEDYLSPVMDELPTMELAGNQEMINYLNRSSNDKMILVNEDGQVIGMYSFGHPIDINEDERNGTIWRDIKNGPEFEDVLNRRPYTREIRRGSKVIAYEIGLPVQYGGQPAYAILHQFFWELYEVLDMNRRQLVFFSILLTVASAVLAAFLSRRFTRPIHKIKKTVDKLTEGDLTATPGIHLRDEVGDLALAIEQLGQELQRVETLRREVIANVSHELRSPLALIGGYAEMVRDIHWQDPVEREADLNLIMKEARRMSEMVSDILDYSQLQAGYSQLHKDEHDLFEIVESEVFFCEQSAAEYQIAIVIDEERRGAVVSVDALKLSRVIRNLLYNAINHTGDGGTIHVKFLEHEAEYEVDVINQGEPIPEEERSLIWERYQKSQHMGGRNKGTGIGLSIVSSILQAHEMPYGVDCRDGQIIFWFRCAKA